MILSVSSRTGAKGGSIHPSGYSASMKLVGLLLIALAARAQTSTLDFLNRNLPIPDAHNCYPYEGQWADRIDRALKTPFPVAIEQDIAWYVDPATGKGRPVLSHSEKTTGAEPS